MTSSIRVSISPGLSRRFISALLRNLEGPDMSTVLTWILDAEGNFHTRVHYGRSPLTVFTDKNDGNLFSSLEMMLETQPLEPENSDMLSASVSRGELGEATDLADKLVERLLGFVRPDCHDIARLIEKFNNENK